MSPAANCRQGGTGGAGAGAPNPQMRLARGGGRGSREVYASGSSSRRKARVCSGAEQGRQRKRCRTGTEARLAQAQGSFCLLSAAADGTSRQQPAAGRHGRRHRLRLRQRMWLVPRHVQAMLSVVKTTGQRAQHAPRQAARPAALVFLGFLGFRVTLNLGALCPRPPAPSG